MAKSTWRFEFVDINKSITITEAEQTWIGYAVIRAPKGTTEAMFVPAGNKQRIEAMFGYASADWPDLYEVIDFNNEYGVYISAPTVETKEYPNYYGGVYFTRYGVQPFYRFSNKNDPNYEIGIVPGLESTYYAGSKNSKFTLAELNKKGEQAHVKIEDIPNNVFKKMTHIDLDFPTYKGTFRYKIDKANGYTIIPDDSMNVETQLICGFCQQEEDGDWTIHFGNIKGISNSAASQNWVIFGDENPAKDILNFDFTAFSSAGQYDYTNFATDENGALTADGEGIKNAIETGTQYKIEKGSFAGLKVNYGTALYKRFHFVLNIEEDVYSYHVQVSPTSQKTTITIDSPVYDKWQYDIKATWAEARRNASDELVVPTPTDTQKTLLAEYDYLCVVAEENGPTFLYEYQLIEKEDDEGNITANWEWVNVTEDYTTVRILAFEPLVNGSENDEVHHTIYFVDDGSLVTMTEDNLNEDYKLRENIWYNSYHSESVEEDSAGELHHSGNFTGSLDEFGVDENNGDIFWGELIPPGESVVYAEPYVVKTFDKDLDDKGIYKYTRIDSVSKTVSGQRYVDYVVSLNIAEGKTGGNCTDASEKIKKKFCSIMKEGLIEARKPKYADVSIFFECTGLADIKSYFTAIRTTHYCSTNISPMNINEQLLANTKKIRTVNPLRGSAQYIQELQYKDKNLRKKYYACPIGAMAAMLVRIMELYYGGVGPYWLNDKGVGGQIDSLLLRTPIKARWDFTDEDTKILDEKGLNPILMDVDDGVMAVSQRTTELNVGDWCYLGHTMAFDLCKKEIRDNVMKPQLGKKINPYWMQKRQEDLDKILSKRTTGNDPIWSQANGDIAGVNDDYTKAQRIFNIAVDVTVFPFSEKVRLTFTNNAQTTSVSD